LRCVRTIVNSDRMPEPTERAKVIVLGLGNLILMDDGVGIHAVRRFRELAHREILAVDVGTDVFSAVHLLEQADKVVAFDAMFGSGKPGTIYLVEASGLANEGVKGSLHELDLSSVLQMLNGRRPEVIVVAAEPGTIKLGTELSPAVQAAVPEMVRAAVALTSYWLSLAPEAVGSGTDLAQVPWVVPLANAHVPASVPH